jgi:hypothetical protein
MTLQDLINNHPCIEELEGYRGQGLKDGDWQPEKQELYLRYMDALMSGREIPAPSKLLRNWTYTRGKPPKKKIRAVSE